jgi:bacillithiol biosynthesis cysteine-adding enzyme BshC
MHRIPYSQIPNQPQILLDAIDSFSKVSAFFNGNFRDPDSYRNLWRDIQTFPFKRQAVSDVLVKELKRLHAPAAALDNARLIADSKTASVLTGQQIGLIGGPIYTVVKAIAAIRWAEHLSQVLDTPVVPIFWMEGEDHDFEEIRRVSVLDRDGNLASVALDDHHSNPHRVVGWRRPKKEMSTFFERLADVLPAGLHRNDVMDRVRDCYKPGTSLSDAFARWMLQWLGDYGLVVAGSLNPGLKQLASPYFQRAVAQADRHAMIFKKRQEEIQSSGYPCTLTPSTEFQFFYILEDGVRKPVPRDMSEDGMTKDDLLKIAKDQPERFSPKAVLRPVIQDVLFPTVAIIAGPSELCYFPQVQSFYQDCKRPMPVIIPRPGITMMEKSWARNLKKLSLTVEDFFQPEAALNKRLAMEAHSDLLFGMETMTANIARILRDLESQASSSMPVQSKHAEKLRQDVESRIQQFLTRIQNDLAASDEITMRRVEELRTVIFPNGKLQERVYSPLIFLIRHGFQWVADQLASVPVDEFEHVVLPMEE